MYLIIMLRNYSLTKTDLRLTNNYDIEIGDNANMNIMIRSGALNLNVNGNVNLFSNDDVNISCDNFRVDASNKVTISSGDKMLLDSSGENDINGNPINLN